MFRIQTNFQISLFLYFSEALISAIQEDIEEAKRQLDLPEHLKLKEDNFFRLPEGKTVNKQWTTTGQTYAAFFFFFFLPY